MSKITTTRRDDPLGQKSFQLAVRMVKLSRYLVEEKKEFIISKQIIRSGTSPGAMVREAANAESGQDFIHKLGIAQKEVGETQFWLELLCATNFINEAEYESLHNDCKEVMNLLRSSILTKKKKLGLIAISVVTVAITAASLIFT
ncbi:MAG: four helix bundle protein [Saprospiraceae bacterium]|nr:four helix bundle protein [Saprospiraceae bacterium]